MRKLLFLIFSTIFFISCENKKEISIQKWEYKLLRFRYEDYYKISDTKEYMPDYFVWMEKRIPLKDSLLSLGEKGWELTSIYTTTATSFPNFGNDKYVTGIREQTATRVLTVILKRPYIEKKEKDKNTQKKK